MCNIDQATFSDVRLEGGDNSTTGRIEYYGDSKWHTIRFEGFDKREADLMCKKLGFELADKFGNASSLK